MTETSMPLVLAIDVGTTRIKVAVATATGDILDISTSLTPVKLTPKSSLIDGKGVIEKLASTIKKLNPDLRRAVKVISISTLAPSLFFLDEKGIPLGDGLIYNDPRGVEFLEKLREEKDLSWWLHETGNIPNIQSCLHKFSVLSHETNISSARWAGSIATVINAFFTGEVSLNTVEALEWGFLSLRSKRWNPRVISTAGIDPSLLPPLVEPTSIAGYLKGDVAEKLGLPKGIPVAGGGVDFVLATLGAGVTESGEIYMSHGTTSCIGVVSEIPRPSFNLFLDYHVLPGKYIINGCTAMTGEILRRLAEDMNIDLSGKWDNNPEEPSGIIFLPFFSGERTPYNDPWLRAAVIGMSLRTTKTHLLKAMMESIAFLSREHIEEYKKMGVYPVKYVASGGLMKIPEFGAILASVLGAEIRVLAYDSSLVGAARLGSLVLGMKDMYMGQDSKFRVIYPIPRLESSIKKYYATFRELIETLSPFLHRLARWETNYINL